MLLVVSLIGSSVLMAGVIGGYLILKKVRISSDITNSAKAIYAAETIKNCALYNKINKLIVDPALFEDCPGWDGTLGALGNGAEYEVKIEIDPVTSARYFFGIGKASKSFRIIETIY